MTFTIAGRAVVPGAPLVAIAELGLNHGGDPALALRLVDAAKAAGASLVKLQSLRAEQLLTADAPAPAHVSAASLRDFFRAFELDEAAHRAVATRARSLGLGFMSTPFDEDAVAMLVRLEADAIKIASGDLTNHHLIARAARVGRPLILSTGMASFEEIGHAVECARSAGAERLALLHCVSAYPVPEAEQNLKAIAALAQIFEVPVGLSDHSTNPLAAALAVSQGAVLYERHLVADDEHEAIDRPVSSTPAQLAEALGLAERARVAMGDGAKLHRGAESANRVASRRGIYAARALEAGEVVDEAALAFLRPAGPIDASLWHTLVGRRARRAIRAGEPFDEASLSALESPPPASAGMRWPG